MITQFRFPCAVATHVSVMPYFVRIQVQYQMYGHKHSTAYLETGLERQLQLGALDDDVGEVEEMYLERIQHSLTCDDDLFGLLLHREGTDQCSHLLSRLPLSQL